MTEQDTTEECNTIDIREILQLLPHRYPMLLIDRVLDYKENKSLKALKNVSFNEPQFTGHFPQAPIFPGVLILEAMAQATGILAFKSYLDHDPDELYYFASIDNAKFRRPVVPGDQLILNVEFIKERGGITLFKGVATVDDKEVCTAMLKCARRKVSS